MILFIGIVTSYEDIKTGKIRNKWILAGLIYAIFMNIGLFVYHSALGDVRIAYFIELLITGGFSLVVGFVLWNVGLWTAGDAKLYLVYSLLVPLSTYVYGHIPYFSSTNILINTFVPLFVYFTFLIAVRTNMKEKLHYFLKSLDFKQIGTLGLFFFGFMWVSKLLFQWIGINMDFFTSVFIFFILIVSVEKFLSIGTIYIGIGLAVLRIIFDKNALSASSLQLLLITLGLFIIVRFFILSLGYAVLTRQTDIGLLKPGMVPAERVYRDSKGNFKKESMLQFTLMGYMKKKKKRYLFEADAKGLSVADVNRLKKLEKSLGFEHLRVHQTVSFAPYLFGGVLLTIMFHGNMIISLLT